jgi:hypothetical protein
MLRALSMTVVSLMSLVGLGEGNAAPYRADGTDLTTLTSNTSIKKLIFYRCDWSDCKVKSPTTVAGVRG